MRIRGKAPFRAKIKLEGRRAARFYDLDERRVVYEGKFEGEPSLDLGPTNHDFILLIEKLR